MNNFNSLVGVSRVDKLAICLAVCLLPVVAVAQNLPDPVTDADYAPVRVDEARLGQLLFYDPILSGNKTVACATCHHPAFGTSDGLSLGIGDGGIGLGPNRRIDPDNVPEKRIPRNSPALFNLGAFEFTTLFHDGRLEADPNHPGGIRTPLDADMVAGFASVLSAQSMFPVLSRDEMAGSHRENPIAKAVRQGRITGKDGAWDQISRRVAAIPAYASRFTEIYPAIQSPDDIAFTDISNAIAAFIAFEWRSETSPFDQFLRGERKLGPAAAKGLTLFYGKARCATCHSGKFQTDHGFHAMATPQIGPGKAATFETHTRDDGRFRVTGNPADQFKFRTPSLRNVALTAPFGHAGAHTDLAAFVAFHADPALGLQSYSPVDVILPDFEAEDFAILDDARERQALIAAMTTPSVALSEDDVAAIVAFLGTLTDPISLTGRLGVPDAVPSGLSVPDVN